MTQIPFEANTLNSTKFIPQAAGAGEDLMANMLEESLTRLGTDYIDLYWIHNPAWRTELRT